MNEWEKIAIKYLPDNLRHEAEKICRANGGQINEIRVRRDRPLCLNIDRKLLFSSYICSPRTLNELVDNLCQNSLYSFAESIREGYIFTEYGIRVGVCGRAVVRADRIDCVRDISSVNIRVPHRITGAANRLYETVAKCGSTLVYSRPGMGKTTVLRELIPLLCSEGPQNNISVIDTRYELTVGLEECRSVDIFLGYPRKEGIMSATRTMTPDYIICDEIADEGDAEAILNAHSAGITVIASAHAGSIRELYKNSAIKKLVDFNVFKALYGITEKGDTVDYIDDSFND